MMAIALAILAINDENALSIVHRNMDVQKRVVE
jgi:hypothetical protein